MIYWQILALLLLSYIKNIILWEIDEQNPTIDWGNLIVSFHRKENKRRQRQRTANCAVLAFVWYA